MVDTKITALPVAGVLTNDDVFPFVDSPGATPTTKQITALAAKTYFSPPPPAADGVYYVSGAGVDSANGLARNTPMRTLAVAYAALPATGGTIMVLPGRYDVGSGFIINRSKPVWLYGMVRAKAYETSNSTVPIADNTAAVIYSGTGAVDLISFAGTAQGFGFRASNLVFELVVATTKHAISAVDVSMGEVDGCLFYADKTTATTTTAGGYTAGLTGPAAVDAVAVVAYSSVSTKDASWWRIHNNVVGCMALCILGNDGTPYYNCNQQVVRDNTCLGLGHFNVSVLPPNQAGTVRPCIRIRGGNRCVVDSNNVEAYNIGIQFQDCWACREAGDGGEFVDVMVDIYNAKSMMVSPLGIFYGPTGSYAPYVQDAILVRGDSFVKGCVFILPTWTSANTERVYPPTNDPADPSIQLGSADNIVIASRWTSLLGVTIYSGVGSPNGAMVGKPGDQYTNTSGGAGTTLYVKESGAGTNTGWVGK